MDIKQLRYFAEVAAHENFSRAAERLRITQPALSRHILRLEQELGVALFLRVGRGVVLTKPGALLSEHAAAILRHVQRASDAVVAEGNVPQGSVAIGAPPSIGYSLFPVLVDAYHALYPDVTVRLLEGITSTLMDCLRADTLDVALISGASPTSPPENAQGLACTAVGTEGMFVFGPREGEPLPESMSVYRLADLPLILTGKPNMAREILEAAALKAGVRLRVKVEVESQMVMKSLVKRGMGYSVVPFSTLHDDAHEFATSRLKGMQIGRMLVRRADRPPTPATSELMRLTTAKIEVLRRSGFFDPQHSATRTDSRSQARRFITT